MSLFSRKVRAFVVSISAIGLLAMGVSSSATAAPAPTPFTSTGILRLEGSITLKQAGASPVSCPKFDVRSLVENIGGTQGFANAFGYDPLGECANGTHLHIFGLQVKAFRDLKGATTSFPYVRWLERPPVEQLVYMSPYGSFQWKPSLKLPWVNGGAGTPSKIVLNETVLGYQGSAPITATGTLNATVNGGAVTLN